MTDAEIIRALECCSQDTHDCDNCPLNIAEESLCFNEIKGYALDLINRQKAEIERLQKENNQLADIGKMYSEIKTEAIKEFAERVKSRLIAVTYMNFDDTIDTLVKEVAGDTE